VTRAGSSVSVELVCCKERQARAGQEVLRREDLISKVHSGPTGFRNLAKATTSPPLTHAMTIRRLDLVDAINVGSAWMAVFKG
jgi:hypothetical protein